ncbi:hypothetical protein [Streptomyces sp. V1I1]|uniref:hypothetical protein n=1 Tax=Streptomyces sp. V1I1 TaxID=3042272 RepID=UPI002788BF66|nr:hypothetical protein [Streptomyces sp. V1I1]MDQ0938474.1 hypothetical protein [Streptomyces sp. V1I1]
MTTTGSGGTGKGLSIKVYRVDRETNARTPVKACTLPAAKALPFSMAYPPCACPRCRGASTQ